VTTADLQRRLSAALADRYRIERELGAGGMATVYLAEDLRHHRQVAIKVLRPELAAVLGAERFVQEITTTAQLQHPHILPLFDSGSADGFLFYVMPYIEGETLRAKLDREKQLGIEEAVRITREVADALDYAHRHGVIHRDIKPENILLHDGRPMVADFGIALAVSAAAGGRMTETGMSLGTPHYMSPEQATAEKEITARSDVYSLASVLYEMLAGQPPHLGGTAQQIIMKIIAEPVVTVTSLRKSVPPNVAAALEKALEKLPADRFDGARAFVEALANPAFRAAATAGAAVPPSRRTYAGATTTILAVLVVLLVAALAWALSTGGRASTHPTVYDVGLPDSAPLAVPGEQPFAVSPRGDFVVYVADEGGRYALWYRSLRDGTARRIQGAEWASQPAISPDGARLAFLRTPKDSVRWTLEIVPIEGGATTTLGVGNTEANLQWLDDGRLQVVEGDGSHVRWFDPGGGPTEERPTPYCILPTYVVDRDRFLCGGGGDTYASLVPVLDTTRSRETFWTGVADSTFVFGTDFHLVDGRYLVYLSLGGDLLAATVDFATRRVGRSVRLVTGIQRTAYWGAGSYGLSRSGTLVYTQGPNYAVGSLVATDGRTFDTLNVGRAQFHLVAMSPDGRRLAAVVDDLEGAELRVYTLATGDYVLLARSPFVRQPVWSPRGDQIMFTVDDTLFLGVPDGSMAPRQLGITPDGFEAFSWSTAHQVVGGTWDTHQALMLDPTKEPLQWDTVATEAAFPSASPDGRWIAYNDPPLTTVWISPIPPNGRRYQIGPGWEPIWRSSSELVLGHLGGAGDVSLDFSGTSPVAARSRTVPLPDFTDTAGQSYQLTPDGRHLYIRTVPVVPRRYLRVVPDWVDQMKRAVDEANP